ncbi:MAG: GNAT family N-acetyltransferase [Solirubrobacterales bacterium]
MNVELADALATERRLLEPICELWRSDAGLVFRSRRFPGYYGANGIEIDDPASRRLAAWEETFHDAFDPGHFEHVTLKLVSGPDSRRLVEEARAAGYDVSQDAYLVATEALPAEPSPPDGLRLEVLKGEDGWRRLAAFEDRLSRGYGWYSARGVSQLLQKTRFVSARIGIEWLGLSRDDDLRSKLGVFRAGPVCRLQDVATLHPHRRRGLASHLVRVALDRALGPLGAEGLVVCAERDYHAIDLYRKLGFRELGETVTLMRYPIRNPEGAAHA